jgi:hypothetical protein
MEAYPMLKFIAFITPDNMLYVLFLTIVLGASLLAYNTKYRKK